MSLLLVRQCRSFGRLGHQTQKAVQLPCFSFSSSPTTESNDDLVLSRVDEDAGIAMLTMNRPPANSLSLEMNEAICNSIKTIESNHKIQSLILTSNNPRIFSAGIDVAELVAPDADRLPKFWNSLQQINIDLYGSRLATVAAIEGHAPAAGCFLAMATDYRIMSAGDVGDDDGGDKKKKKRHVPTIGMNETMLGIAAPFWMGQLLVRTIGFRQAELALALGTLYPPKEALEIGLVDELVPQQSSESDVIDYSDTIIKDQATNPLMQRAYKQATMLAKIPPQARVASKMVTREDPIQDMISKRQEDTDHFCDFVTQGAVQSNLAAYVDALKNKSKKK